MARTRGEAMQRALDRVLAGERVGDVARATGLQATALHAAMRTEKRRASAEAHRQATIRDAKRYQERRKRAEDAAAYDEESDAMVSGY